MKAHRSNQKCASGFSTPNRQRSASIAAARLTFFAGLFLCGQLLAFDLEPVLRGSYATRGEAVDVAVSGNYAYVADGWGGLQVIDVSNPAALRCVGSWDTSGVLSVTVSGDYAYVADWSAGLQVLDVSNPANPHRVGGYSTSRRPGRVAVSRNYAFVAIPTTCDESGFECYWGGLEIVDISDPAHPSRVTGYDAGGFTDVAVSGNYAYVTTQTWQCNDVQCFPIGRGLDIIDVSNPAIPQRVGGYDTSGDAKAVTVSGNYAYVADGWGGLQVIDVSNPVSPHRVGGAAIGYALDVAVLGKHAYVASAGGLEVFDVSNPAAPRRVGGFSTLRSAWGLAVCANYGYMTDEKAGLLVIDMSNPANPQRLGAHDTLDAQDVALSGNYAYVADGDAGLQVVDMSNPANPQRVGGYDISGEASSVAVSDNYACVVDRRTGLHVIDVSNPANPQRVGGYSANGWPEDVAVAGNHAYMVESPRWDPASQSYVGGGLEVINLSNPANPQRMGCYNAGSYAIGVTLSHNYAYVVTQTMRCDPVQCYPIGGGFDIIDISNPANPQRVGRYTNTSSHIFGVVVSSNYAYVAAGDAGFEVVDVGNPANIRRVGWYDTHGYASGVSLSDIYAYVADSGGLRVIDVSNPATPRRVGGNSAFGAPGVTVANGKVFVPAREQGLIILHEYQPLRFERIARQDNGAMRLRVAGPPVVSARVQRSADLRTWTDWLPVTFGESPLEVLDPDAASQPVGFYRIAVP